MRLIDGDALITKYGDWYTEEGTEEGFIGTIKSLVDTMPTIEPEPQWIPCGERLPKSDERVLVYTVANEYHVWDAMPHRGKGYAWEDEEGLYHNLYEVEMWMPLPEPYQ